MKSVVLLLSALLIFASWVDAANPFPNADETCTQVTYTGKNGTIDFPGEGNNYNNSLNCLFKINVAENHFVQFSFSRFDFELAQDGKKCYDWLKFIDGIVESDNTTEFCNNGPDPLNKTFSSKNNEITLWMYSDTAESGKGFKLNWTAVEVEPECDCNDIGTESKDCKKETEKCTCKPGYQGAECDQCTQEYWNSSASTGECKKCNDCNNCSDNQIGTCNRSNGECECSCKVGFKEEECEECKENYWMSSSECKECESCDGICEENQTGSCNKSNGKCDCSCKDGYKGDKCEECEEDYWMSSNAVAVGSQIVEVLSECKECESCDGICEENQTGSCNKSNGECVCRCKDGYKGDNCDKCEDDYWMSSNECEKCDDCSCKENQKESCNKSNGKCECSSAATFAFNKTIVLFTAFLIFLSHQN